MDVLLLPVGLVFGFVRRIFRGKPDDAPPRPADPDAVHHPPQPGLPEGGWSAPPPPSD
jgi:hypothetical protein